jgi:DNA-binding response OmpR family regulator
MTPPDPHKSDSSRGTILIVDDAMDMRVFISALFKTNGYRTETCRDGSAGLAKAREITPDLIVLDVMMPGTGGALMYKASKRTACCSIFPSLCCRPWGSDLSSTI